VSDVSQNSFAPVSPDRRRWRWGLAIFLVVLGLAGVSLWFGRGVLESDGAKSAPAEVVLPEVERSALVLKDGQLRLGDRIYTGLMLEHYPNGVLKSRSVVSNGVLHGLSEGWFTNQTLQVSEHFVNGISHGERLRWDAEGRKVAAAQIVHGKIEGVFRRWYENGVVAEEVTMTNGEPEGLSRAWYPSGFLKAEVRLVHGQVKDQHRYKDGERRDADGALDKVRAP